MAKSYGSGSSSGHPLGPVMKTIADNTKATADALARIATLTQRAQVAAAGGTGGSVGGGLGGGAGGGGGGLGLGAALRGGIGGYGASQIVNNAASVARIGNNSFATGDQKLRSLAGIVPGGSTALNYIDSVSGRQDAMERTKMAGEQAAAQARFQIEKSNMERHFNVEQARYQGTAGAYARGSAVTAGVFDRGIASGRLASEDAQRQLPYRKATAEAERSMAAATSQRVASEKELVKLQKEENGLMQQSKNIQKALDKGGSGPERQWVHEQDKANATLLEANRRAQQQAQGEVVANRRGEIGAKGEFSKAQVRQQMLGQADNLRARAGEAQGTAGRLGSMNPAERSMAVEFLKAMKQPGFNPDGMADEQKALVSQAFPAEYSAIIEAHGSGTDAMKEATKAGFRGTGDFAGLGKQADTLEEKAGKEEYKIDSKAAADAAAAGARMADKVGAIIDRMSASFDKQIENKFREMQNHTK